MTADVTNIDFTTKVVDSHNAWSGTVFAPPRAGWYDFKGVPIFTAANTAGIYVFVNAVKKVLLSTTVNTDAHAMSGGLYLLPTDSVTFRSDTAATLSNSATAHTIAITSQG